MGFSFQEIGSLRVRLNGTIFIVVNHPLHHFSEYEEFFLWLIRMNTSKRSHAAPLTFNVVSRLGILSKVGYLYSYSFIHFRLRNITVFPKQILKSGRLGNLSTTVCTGA